MTHASLFSGIGGFDLAAEWVGWTNTFNCEIDPFCQNILKCHFPNAIQYGDIKTTDFTLWRGRIDVLTGGFPCQPFSLAGKRKGTQDDRYLWPEMLRVIRTVRPRWVVGENVLGIVNWSKGMVFEQVCADLEAEGYEVQPFVIPACGVGAPHQRYRTWFVAHAGCYGRSAQTERKSGSHEEDYEQPQSVFRNGAFTHCADVGAEAVSGRQDSFHTVGNAADTDRFGGREIYNEIQSRQPNGERTDGIGDERNAADTESQRSPVARKSRNRRAGFENRHIIPEWRNFPTQSPVCSRYDGVPGRLDGITFSSWRIQSIKGFGIAIVPQVALQIFETINEYEFNRYKS